MISESKAIARATDANLMVSNVKKTKLAGRFVNASKEAGKQAIRHEMTVGRAICFYETDIGGASCWQVELDGTTHRGGFKGEAIAMAVSLQKAA